MAGGKQKNCPSKEIGKVAGTILFTKLKPKKYLIWSKGTEGSFLISQ